MKNGKIICRKAEKNGKVAVEMGGEVWYNSANFTLDRQSGLGEGTLTEEREKL